MKKNILMLGAAVALAVALALPGAVIASDGTTDVIGQVVEEYTFTAPSTVDLGNMEPTDEHYTGNSTDGMLEGNNPTGYTVTGKDMKDNDTGHMVSGDDVLHYPLSIGSGGDTCPADSETTFLTTDGPGRDAVPLYVSQYVTLVDPAGQYSITITFTVTANT